MRIQRSWRRELPLPGGERVGGGGVRTSEQKLGVPNPLILFFSPISTFTRVFDALWGRRNAASRPRSSSLRPIKRKTGTGETPVHEHDPEKWGPVFRKIMLH